MKKKSSNTVRTEANIFHRFHFIIFFIVVSLGISLAIWHINTMLSAAADDTTYTSQIGTGSIDSTTLERINQLRSSANTNELPASPDGVRINPFGE